MSRQVGAHELELFAINCGDLYQNHKHLVGTGLSAWMAHVISEVLPRFCRQVEPVQITAEVTKQTANALADYYHRQANEWAGAVMKARKVEKEKKVQGSNVIPATTDTLATAQQILHRALMSSVAVTGNPADGFIVVGPFARQADAERYLDTHDSAGWVLPLHAPPGDQQ